MRPHPVACFVVLTIACSRSSPRGSPDAAPSAAIDDAAAPPPTASAPPPAPSVPVAPIEARRTRITRIEDEPALVAAADALKKHFGGQVPRALDVQSVVRSDARGRAVLVFDATQPDGRPFVVAVDGAGAVQWTKEHPAGGIVPPVGPMAIAGGPSGRVALAVCDPPTKRVALRLWDDDGTAFAEFDAMDMDDCSAVSILYWPKRGWIIAASQVAATRAQLVSEHGRLAWQRGTDVGARTTTGAPASLAADTDDTFVLAQYASPSGAGQRAHALAFRYDAHGSSLWSSPTNLGAAPATRPDDRIALSLPRPGVVRATLARGVDVDVTSNGTVIRGARQGQ